MFQHFASAGERAKDASGDVKRTGAMSADAFEWEADDADSRTAGGERERGVLPLAQRRAVPRDAMVIA